MILYTAFILAGLFVHIITWAGMTSLQIVSGKHKWFKFTIVIPFLPLVLGILISTFDMIKTVLKED